MTERLTRLALASQVGAMGLLDALIDAGITYAVMNDAPPPAPKPKKPAPKPKPVFIQGPETRQQRRHRERQERKHQTIRPKGAAE